MFQYCEGKFNPAFVSTVGIDFKVKTVRVGERRIKLQVPILPHSPELTSARFLSKVIPMFIERLLIQVWDTAGQERYKIITTQYYRHAMGFLLMYDITSETSFLDVRNWLSQVRFLSRPFSFFSHRFVLLLLVCINSIAFCFCIAPQLSFFLLKVNCV